MFLSFNLLPKKPACMHYIKLSAFFAISLCISVIFASCTGVKITNSPIPVQVNKLKLSNTKKIKLTTQSNENSQIIGHQYLFLFIPFGRIITENPDISLYNKAYSKLAVKGYKIENSKLSKMNRLHLTINNLRLTAYDLLFIRNIYCETEIKMDFLDPDNRVKYSQIFKAKKSSYKPLAFSKELQHIYEQCLDQAVNQLLNNI